MGHSILVIAWRLLTDGRDYDLGGDYFAQRDTDRARRRAVPPGNVAAAFAVAMLAAVVCFVPVAGRTVEQWTPVVARYGARRLAGRHRFRSRMPQSGHDSDGGVAPDVPDSLAGLSILSAPVGSGGQIGVLCDRRADTYTAVLAVAGSAFALLESSDKQRLLAGWDDVLRGLGGEASPVHRLQWIERTAPDDGDGLGRDLRERAAAPADSAWLRSYVQVLDEAGRCRWITRCCWRWRSRRGGRAG